MKATIVFDNTTTRADLQPDWGFACVVELAGRKILFDTGANGAILLENMKQLNIDPNSINDVFISHNHFDHIGGLAEFLNVNRDVYLFLPPSLRGVRNAEEITYLEKPTRIAEGVYSTGELQGIEQAMSVETGKGLVLFVGCSHPRMELILHAAKQFGELYGIIGGLHGFNQYELFAGLKLICPTHCTQHKAELKKKYPDQYLEGGVGRVINI
ncbi:MAG TPA: MBL fold metallo-hydrolase [Caldithrix sp.]|nr:MBL fold metallo-hydrolase [Caldithrix sp.]